MKALVVKKPKLEYTTHKHEKKKKREDINMHPASHATKSPRGLLKRALRS